MKAFDKKQSRTPTTSKMELFVSLGNGIQFLTYVTENSILNVVGVLDTSLRNTVNVLFLGEPRKIFEKLKKCYSKKKMNLKKNGAD